MKSHNAHNISILIEELLTDAILARFNGHPFALDDASLQQFFAAYPKAGKNARALSFIGIVNAALYMALDDKFGPRDPTLRESIDVVGLLGIDFIAQALKAGGAKRTQKMLESMLADFENVEPDEEPDIDWKRVNAILKG